MAVPRSLSSFNRPQRVLQIIQSRPKDWLPADFYFHLSDFCNQHPTLEFHHDHIHGHQNLTWLSCWLLNISRDDPVCNQEMWSNGCRQCVFGGILISRRVGVRLDLNKP